MKNRNKKSRGRTVLSQHLKDIKTGKSYSNEDSPHWDWAAEHSYRSPEGEIVEHSRANPDWLAESPEENTYDLQLEQREAIAFVKSILTDKERRVLELLETGLSQVGVARILGVSRAAVSMTVGRIRKKFPHEG